MQKKLILLIIILLPAIVFSQSYTYSGYVKDAASGESLISANLQVATDLGTGTSSNTYGFFSLTLPEGEYDIIISYLGYQNIVKHLILNKDIRDDINMSEGVLIDEIVVTAEAMEQEKNVQSTQLGVNKLPVAAIKSIPAIMGEVDVLKAIQLLPGVSSTGEGSSGFYVRGGGADQNLVLLDEATVYNTGHLMGFFSVFNADALNNTSLIKGTMPAKYGGRLSSVLDIQMKEGGIKKYSAEGGVGLISSRLTFQGPIIKNKSSFILSGRRTYLLDLMQPFINKTDFKGTNYYFYDLNAKLNYRFSDKDRLFVSGYFGRDVFKFSQPKNDFGFKMPYGNITTTVRWNHLFNDKLFMNLSTIYNDYQFSFSGEQNDFEFKIKSGINAYQTKLDFEYFPSPKHEIKFGTHIAYHKLSPNIFEGSDDETEFTTNLSPKYGGDINLYASDKIKINNKLSIDLGLRLTRFSQFGPYTSINDTSKVYKTLESVVNYSHIAPRASFRYLLNNELSLKGGISYTDQYLHLVSNSSTTLPLDIWVPSTENVKPQYGVQYSIGLFKNFFNNTFETSIEGYYKNLDNQIDYADNYVSRIGEDVEKAFVYGEGRAYGMELFIKKNKGKLNGWIGYTLSKAERSFDDIEDGRWYPTSYDRTHDISVVANYQLSKKWNISAVFIYGTGKTYTPILGYYYIDQTLNRYYGPRNSARLNAYHRMDISATFTPKGNKDKQFHGSWNFSIYNLYNRKNPFFINYELNSDFNAGTSSIKASKITIFPIIPSISYIFKWQQK